MLSADAIVKLHDELDHRMARRSPKSAEDSSYLPIPGWPASPASIAPTSTSGTSRTKPARPAPPTPNSPTSSAASTTPTSSATTSPRISTAPCSTGLLRSGCPPQTRRCTPSRPGLIIDRLSILALKIYHTREEAERTDCAPGHAERNRARLAILTEQRADLARCLDLLWRETLAGTRRFKLYRQLKMYNDPTLNPAIYRNSQSESGSLIAHQASPIDEKPGLCGIKRA